MLTRRGLGLLAAGGALAGCGSVKPNLYAVSVVPGPALGGGPGIVELRQVGLARYLDRQSIVQSSAGYRFTLESNDWWGEALGPMLTRVLAQELGQRLPGTAVFAETGVVVPAPDATLTVNITQLDQDGGGMLVLLAQAQVERSDAPPIVRSFAFRVPVANATTLAHVEAVSAAIGQLADGTAAMLRQARSALSSTPRSRAASL